jgi:cephalosporin hydroxylase
LLSIKLLLTGTEFNYIQIPLQQFPNDIYCHQDLISKLGPNVLITIAAEDGKAKEEKDRSNQRI